MLEDEIITHLESLETLLEVNRRIRKIEGIILEMSKARENQDDDVNIRIVKTLDELVGIIENVELRANELDIQISAIERLSNS